MKPSQHDLDVWTARNAPLWARAMLKHPPRSIPALHYAINARAKSRQREALEPGNAMAVLRMVRKRGEDLYCYMIGAAVEYKRVQPERATTYRRWLRRIEQRRA
jgi:hypothetical protein